jgi:hypothetical protein
MTESMVKLEIFIPPQHLEQLKKTLQSAGAGAFGNYDSVLSYSRVKGCWRPLEGSDPHIGEVGVHCLQDEYKVEVNCPKDRLEQVVLEVRKIHPYEAPVINIIPLLTLPE